MFSWVEDNGLKYLKIDEFQALGIKAYFTSRIGGYSSGCYSSLNLGLHPADRRENVLQNRRLLAESLGLDFRNFVTAEQVHGDKVHLVTKQEQGAGSLNYQNSISGVDSLVTAEKGIPLLSFYADCVPLLLADPVKKVVALAHAGWKGTVKKIGSKTVKFMKEKYDVDPANIRAAIGPSISKDFYEVDEIVAGKFKEAFAEYPEFMVKKNKGHYLLDLWQANINSLIAAGLTTDHISVSNYCTYRDNHYFYSYRKEAGKTGRMASIIYL